MLTGPAKTNGRGSDVNGFLDDLALSLGRSVLLDDLGLRRIGHGGPGVDRGPAGDVVRRAVPPELVERVQRAAADDVGHFWVPALPGWSMTARLCVPVSRGNVYFGYLWVIDPLITMTEAQVALLRRWASRIAYVLDTSGRVGLEEEQARQRRLRALLGGVGDSAATAADLAAELHVPADSSVLVLAAEVGVSGDPVAGAVFACAVKERLARLHIAATWLVRVADPVLLIGVRPDLSRSDCVAAARAVSRCLSEEQGTPVSVGVAGPPAPWADIRGACRDAATALTVAIAVDGEGGVRSGHDLGAWKPLAELTRELGNTGVLAEMISSLSGLMSESRMDLRRTAEIYCAHGGDVRRTAEALHVHRSTLYYRLSRIAELTGLDPRTGEDRFELMLGLRVARLVAATPKR